MFDPDECRIYKEVKAKTLIDIAEAIEKDEGKTFIGKYIREIMSGERMPIIPRLKETLDEPPMNYIKEDANDRNND